MNDHATQPQFDSSVSTADNPADLVVDLSQVSAGDLPRVGGKAANLGELVRAGFPVPPGFVITTDAYDRVVAANELDGVIAATLDWGTGDGAPIRLAFEQATIPPYVQRAILDGYRQLGGGPVAVRSSATAEDLPDAAFAGQQDTFLGVESEAALLDAVRRCWASLWSDRAISYRAKQGFANTAVTLAVVVQRLVPADVAGVLFTANPISGARDETVIDANPGLGEAVVAGLVTPDHIVLRRTKRGWRIVERTLGRREVVVRPRAGGGVEQMLGAAAAEPALPDAVIYRLARLGAAIQRHFGRPQDVEWAWADGDVVVLQARPMTALPAPPERRGRLGLPNAGPAEYFQIRPYPLDMTTWMPAMGRALARMFPLDSAAPPLDQLWEERDGVVERFAGWPGLRRSPDLLFAPARLVALASRYDPARWRADPLLAELQAEAREMEARDARRLPWPELLALVREAMAFPATVAELRRRYLPRAVLALGGLRLLLGSVGLEDRFGALLSGIENKTLEANRALESLAAEIRTEPALAAIFATHEPSEIRDALESTPAGQAFLPHLHRFFDAYGHRETGSPLLVSQPTWKDAPETVLGILKGLAQSEPASPRAGPLAWETARDEVLAQPALRFPPLRTAFLRLLTAARRFPSLREDTHFYLTMAMPTLRHTLLELGRRLSEIGVLDSPDEVFHLRFDELERIGDWPPSPSLAEELRATAKRRAEQRAALADTPLIAPQVPAPAEQIGDALVRGTPGSPGVAEGPVRIVRDAAAFGTLQPGEVLVAPYTNPAWTPLFGRAAAVVVDAGSAASHAAIVAREYGIPAVMGTGDATRRLRDGQVVRVDGTRGLVLVGGEAGGRVPLRSGGEGEEDGRVSRRPPAPPAPPE
jgi:pyruvate,water dikinase